MTNTTAIFRKALDELEHGTPVAIATIIATSGSVPRHEGTKMLVTGRGEAFGTIGGGIMEKNAIDLAHRAIRERNVMVQEFDFSETTREHNENICGGRLTVVIEPHHPPETVVICGGGHVGFAVYSICTFIGLKSIIIDDREEYAIAERFPEAESVINDTFDKALQTLEIFPSTYIVVCTRRHQTDQQCLEQVLPSNAGYIGMLSSKRKWKQLQKNLQDKRFKKKNIERIHSPIGLDIGALTPEEIAVSIAAELIQHRAKTMQ